MKTIIMRLHLSIKYLLGKDYSKSKFTHINFIKRDKTTFNVDPRRYLTQKSHLLPSVVLMFKPFTDHYLTKNLQTNQVNIYIFKYLILNEFFVNRSKRRAKK